MGNVIKMTKLKTDRNIERKGTFILFVILFFSNDTLLFGTNSNKLFFNIHIVVLLCLFIYIYHIFSKIESIKFRKSELRLFACLFTFILFTSLINWDFSIKYFYELFVFCLCLFIIKTIPFVIFSKSYRMIVCFFSVTSSLMFIIGKFLPSFVKTLPTIINESGYRFYFYGLGFCDSNITRAFSIFREPGVYMIFLALALILELFSREKISVLRVISYITALLLTFSTAAYLVLPLILITYFIRLENNSKTKYYILIMILVLLIFSFVFFDVDEVFYTVFNKLGVANASRDSRLASIPANFDIMLENPFVGKGWSFVIEEYSLYSSVYAIGASNANTIFKLLSVHGIFYGIFIIYGIFRFWLRNNKSKLIGVLLGVIFCIILSNEDMSVNPIIYLLFFYGIASKKGLHNETV